MADKQQSNAADLLAQVEQNFKAWEDATDTERQEGQQARDYFDGKQWTDEEIAVLRAADVI